MTKRKLDLVVLSDIHLGTYGCHAEELCDYLDSIDPARIVLNGDIIDIWNFKKSFWPQAHHEVLERILSFLSKGVEIIYLTGNHDELLRRFSGFHLGNFRILNKLILTLHGKKVWFFHGDVFDFSVQHAKWIARLGGIGYDFLIVLNRVINKVLALAGREPYSLSKRVKASVKKAVSFVGEFETTIADIAIENKFDCVVIGHIHNPEIREISTAKGTVTYLNSGDWVENLTALEYLNGKWNLFHFSKTDLVGIPKTEALKRVKPSKTEHSPQSVLEEFAIQA